MGYGPFKRKVFSRSPKNAAAFSGRRPCKVSKLTHRSSVLTDDMVWLIVLGVQADKAACHGENACIYGERKPARSKLKELLVG